VKTCTEYVERMRAPGGRAELKVYPGAHHGFAFPKRPVYNKDAAERHWERLHALFRRHLQS
jgi:carboxymethylenebutenolidase